MENRDSLDFDFEVESTELNYDLNSLNRVRTRAYRIVASALSLPDEAERARHAYHFLTHEMRQLLGSGEELDPIMDEAQTYEFSKSDNRDIQQHQDTDGGMTTGNILGGRDPQPQNTSIVHDQLTSGSMPFLASSNNLLSLQSEPKLNYVAEDSPEDSMDLDLAKFDAEHESEDENSNDDRMDIDSAEDESGSDYVSETDNVSESDYDSDNIVVLHKWRTHHYTPQSSEVSHDGDEDGGDNSNDDSGNDESNSNPHNNSLAASPTNQACFQSFSAALNWLRANVNIPCKSRYNIPMNDKLVHAIVAACEADKLQVLDVCKSINTLRKWQDQSSTSPYKLVRALRLRQDWIFNPHGGANVLSALLAMCSQGAVTSTEPCARCRRGLGKFSACCRFLGHDGEFLWRGACANCAWTGHSEYCEHSTTHVSQQ